MLTSEVKHELRESFALAAPHATELASRFYARLFQLEPSCRPLFTTDMTEQGEKLTRMLGWIVEHMDETDLLRDALAESGKRHAGYGVRPDHYAPVGSALIYGLRETLGERLTPEAEDAWIEAYAYFAREMESGAAAHGLR